MIYKVSFFSKPLTLTSFKRRIDLFKKTHYQYPSEIHLKGKDYDHYLKLLTPNDEDHITFRGIPVKRNP
jgi:hypothetical protein